MNYAISGSSADSTSAAGAMRFFPAWEQVRWLGAILVKHGTAWAIGTSDVETRTLGVHQQTNAGAPVIEPEKTGAAIAELRRISGFTWEQLARLFGVSRRSLHFWASGKAMSPEHEEHLYRLLATIRSVDRGSASANRRELLTVREDGNIPFDLLIDRRYDEVISLVGRGRTRPRVPTLHLSHAAKAARLPRPPAELITTLHSPIRRTEGRARAGKSVRMRSAKRDRE